MQSGGTPGTTRGTPAPGDRGGIIQNIQKYPLWGGGYCYKGLDQKLKNF